MDDNNPEPKLLIKVNYELDIHDVEAFKAVASGLAIAANAREECAFFKIAQDVRDPTIIYIVEGWRDREAFDIWEQSEDFKVSGVKGHQLRIVGRYARSYDVVSTADLPE